MVFELNDNFRSGVGNGSVAAAAAAVELLMNAVLLVPASATIAHYSVSVAASSSASSPVNCSLVGNPLHRMPHWPPTVHSREELVSNSQELQLADVLLGIVAAAEIFGQVAGIDYFGIGVVVG